MTAEFALLMPAVVLVLGCCLGAVQLMAQQLRFIDAVADGSRSLARGDGTVAASDLVHQRVGAVIVSTEQRGEFVCMTLEAASTFGPADILGISVTATGCALDGGR